MLANLDLKREREREREVWMVTYLEEGAGEVREERGEVGER